MWRGGGNVRITCATEDTKVLIRGCRSKESDMRTRNLDHLHREMVQKTQSGVKPLSPIAPEK
jgi:hypothetical protein